MKDLIQRCRRLHRCRVILDDRATLNTVSDRMMSHRPSDPLVPTINAGDKLGRYDILEQIGSGVSGVVFKGYDAVLDRSVAIKQLLAGQAEDEAFLERCRREIEKQRHLSETYPRLVRIIDLVEEPRGLFVVMEYVDGQSLERLMARNEVPFKPQGALRVIHAAALALQPIHALGIAHGDLKPTNILLPKSGTVKISDLGLASLVAEQEAFALASVRYVAPEIFRNEQATPRADIYSLGMIAYEMLAGRKAFHQAFEAVLHEGPNQALRWMKWHTNPSLMAPALNEVNPQVPVILSELVGRMMEKDPARRIASAPQLIEVIQRHFAGEQAPSAAHAQPTMPSEAAGEEVSLTAALPARRPWSWPWISAAAVGLVLLLALGYVGYMALHQRQVAQANLLTARTQLNEAQELYAAGKTQEALAHYEELAGRWSAETPVGRSARAGKLVVQAQLAADGGNYDAAEAALLSAEQMDPQWRETALRLREEVSHRRAFAEAIETISTRIGEGQLAQAGLLIGQWRDRPLSRDEEAKLLELQVELQGQIVQQRITDILAQAKRLTEAGERDQAIEVLVAARARYPSPRIDEVVDDLTTQREVAAAVAQAEAAEQQGDLAAAIAAYGRALELRDDPHIAQRLARARSAAAVRRGEELAQAGDRDGAIAAFSEAMGYSENPQAQQWLSRMEDAVRQGALIAAGDRAMAAGDYQAAVNQYSAAQQIQADPQLHGKLTAAGEQLLVQQANRAVESGNYEAALGYLDQAKALNPEAQSLAEAVADVQRRIEYRKHLQAGDDLRGKSQFAPAKAEYRRARAVMDTEEIRQRLNDSEYEHLLAQGRSYMEGERWHSAKAVLLTAGELRDTDAVRQLLEEVNSHLSQ
jgi:serine/threonine-protein kinase